MLMLLLMLAGPWSAVDVDAVGDAGRSMVYVGGKIW